MTRALAILLALMMLQGCTLSSKLPLIADSERVPGLEDGRYQLYTLPSKGLNAVPRRLRALCLSPGYGFTVTDDRGKAQGPIYPTYCPFDAPRGPLHTPIALSWQSTGYRTDGASAAFMRLRGTIFLLQSQDRSGDRGEDPPNFDYYLARVVPGGLDIAWLLCREFPSIARRTEKAIVPSKRGRWRTVQVRPLVPSCEAESLAQVRPELDAQVQKLIDRKLPIIALLRRVPDTTAGASAGPPR